MKNSNTLNTRLLPLSILISSLVSGGAMAVPVVIDGGNNGLVDNISTPVADGGAVAVEPAVEQPGLLDKIKDLLGLGEITEDQAKALTENVKAKAEKVDAQAAAKLALESAQAEAQKAAEDALYLKTENVSYQAFAQTEEKIKKEADEAKKKQDKSKEDAIKAVIVNNAPLVPGADDIAEQVTKAVTDTKKVQEEKAVELDEKTTKATEALEAKEANTKALEEIKGRLGTVTKDLETATNTDKPALAELVVEAKAAQADDEKKPLTAIAIAKAADKKTEAELNNNTDTDEGRAKKAEAVKNRKEYERLAAEYEEKIAEAEQKVKDIEAKIQELTKNQGFIKKEQSTEDAKTADLDSTLKKANSAKVAAQGEFDKAETAAKLAETAAKAIEAAKLTDKAVEDATAAHKEAADKAEQTKAAVEASLSIILCNCHRIKGDRSGGHRTR